MPAAISVIRIRYIMEYFYIQLDQLFRRKFLHHTFALTTFQLGLDPFCRPLTATVHGVVFAILIRPHMAKADIAVTLSGCNKRGFREIADDLLT